MEARGQRVEGEVGDDGKEGGGVGEEEGELGRKLVYLLFNSEGGKVYAKSEDFEEKAR